MKNMPEKDNWESIRKRLQEYTEEPDDQWENIFNAIPKPSNSAKRSQSILIPLAAITASAILFFLPISLKDSENYNLNQQKELRGFSKPNIIVEEHSVAIEANKLNSDHRDRSVFANSMASPVSIDELTEGSVQNQERVKSINKFNEELKPVNTIPIDSISESSFIPTTSLQAIASNNPDQSDSSIDKKSIAKKKLDSLKTRKKDIQDKKKRGRSQYYALLTPSLSYYGITTQQATDGRVNGFNSKGIFNEDRMGIAIEVGIQIPLAKKLELHAGLNYYYQNQKLSYQFTHSNLLQIEKETNSFNYTITPHESIQTINYQMNNIGISAGVLYQVNQQKNLIQKLGGSFLYQHGVSTNASSYNNASSSYWGYQLLYRMELLLNDKRTKIFIQPNFVNLIGTREQLDAPISIQSVRAGLSVGIVF
jgi:hypothetical protein